MTTNPRQSDDSLPGYVPDTIVAAATAPGAGGIGIVRISGPAVEEIAVAMLGKVPAPRQATLGSMRDASGEQIDTGPWYKVEVRNKEIRLAP